MTKKILIVDDETDIRETLNYRLAAAGYEVIVAEDGQAGLASVKKEAPDLVI
ncbi:MAG: response regulator, partial [Candidatus Omnitrophica bacterium]|nr:response regulator [Candidatus Omnitrophota bacterium]